MYKLLKRISLLVVLLMPLGLLMLHAQAKYDIVVAQDGSGKYKTVQAAFDAVPFNNKKPVTIYIKNGVYKEKLYLDSSRKFVSMIGEDKFNTILTYNDHTGKVSPKGDIINTRTSWSILMKAYCTKYHLSK